MLFQVFLIALFISRASSEVAPVDPDLQISKEPVPPITEPSLTITENTGNGTNADNEGQDNWMSNWFQGAPGSFYHVRIFSLKYGRKTILEGQYSKDSTRRTVLKGQYSKDSTRKTVLERQYSKDSTRKTVLKRQYSKDSTRRTVLKG